MTYAKLVRGASLSFLRMRPALETSKQCVWSMQQETISLQLLSKLVPKMMQVEGRVNPPFA